MTTGKERNESEESAYGEELMRANWNPVIELLHWSCERTRSLARREERRRALSDEEAAAFLGRVYRSGA
jgi:hypothetical protein